MQVIAERKRINDALKEAGLPTIPGIPDPNLKTAAAAGGGGGGDSGADDGWSRRFAAAGSNGNGNGKKG